MATNEEILASFDINPEDIPTGEEMSQYMHNIGDEIKDSGLVYYDKKKNEACGIAVTTRGLKFFGPLAEDYVVYQGELTDDYSPHGKGSMYNGVTLIKANFIHGCVNDTNAFIITKDCYREACFFCGMLLYYIN